MYDVYAKFLNRAIHGTIEEKKELAYFCLSEVHDMTAFDWFHRIAKIEDSESQYVLGFMYLNGLGKHTNRKYADRWFAKAGENGYSEAQQKLRDIYRGKSLKIYIPDTQTVVPLDSLDEPKKKDLSFRELAFKKSDNGDLVSNVINLRHPEETSEDEDEEESDGHSHDDFYDSLKLNITEPDPERDPFEDLEKLVGLRDVKKQIDMIQKRMAFDQKRQTAGLKTSLPSNHFVFTGNPGTGKNEVARILGHLLHKMGRLNRGHVVEVNSSNLIGGWVGHTALKTRSVIKQAIDGILFIDEAYALYDENAWDFGSEAIATLMKEMEDKRDQFIVVMAGYPDEMKKLLASNPGLKSRLAHHIDFSDFSAEEMVKIYESFSLKEDYILHPDSKLRLDSLMKETVKFENKKTFGNGRFVRNVFEKTIERMAVRITQSNTNTPDDLQTILFSDIPSLIEVTGTKNTKIK